MAVCGYMVIRLTYSPCLPRIQILLEQWVQRTSYSGDRHPLTSWSLGMLQTLLSIPVELSIRQKPSMKELLKVTKAQEVCTIWLSPLPRCSLCEYAYSEAWNWLAIISQTLNYRSDHRRSFSKSQVWKNPSLSQNSRFLYHLIVPFGKIFSAQTRLIRSLTRTRHCQRNIQKTLDISIKEGPGIAVTGKRKRDHRDEGESGEHLGKSKERSKAFKPTDLCGEDDQGGRTKIQRHPHPRNPRTDTHRKTGD